MSDESESEYESSSEDEGSESADESSSGSGSDVEGETSEEYLQRIGAQEHYDEITSQINPSDDPSLLNEANKHYFTARALGVRRGMRDGEIDGDEAFDQLSGVIGGQLADIGVRKPAYGLDDTLEPGTGDSVQYEGGTSSIAIPQAELAGGTLDSETVDTLYHESLHAEQWSLAADVEDGTNDSPSARQTRLAAEWDLASIDIRDQIQAEGGDDYRNLPSEQEAWQAAGDVKTMYENVGAMHDELEERTAGIRQQLDDEAEERAR